MRHVPAVLSIALAACAATPIDTPLEDIVTIRHGVYGRLTETSDVGGVPDSVYPNAAVTVYLRDAPYTQVAQTTSDSTGVYQFEIDTGRYEICTLGNPRETIAGQWQDNCAGGCTFIDVFQDLVRLDWAANLSGGWWAGGDHCPHP